MSAFSHGGIWRALWALIIAAPLCAWLALAVCTLMHQPRAIATGDAFMDAVLGAFVEAEPLATHRLLPPGPGYPECYVPPLRLPEDWWAAHTAQFGNDPRYWALRYNNDRLAAIKQDTFFSARAGVELPACCKYLEQARAQGAENADIRLLFFEAAYYGYLAVLAKEAGQWYCAPGAGFTSDAVLRRGGAKLAALVQELEADIPQQPMAAFVCAHAGFTNGDIEAAGEQLRRYIAAAPGAGAGLPGPALQAVLREDDPLMAGALERWASLKVASAFTSFLDLFPRNARCLLDQINGFKGQVQLETALCGLYSDPVLGLYCGRWTLKIQAPLLRTLRKHRGIQLSAAQEAELRELLEIAERLTAHPPQIYSFAEYQEPEKWSWPWFRSSAALYATRGRSLERVATVEALSQAVARPGYLSNLRELTAKFEQFDFDTFSWRDGAP